jgi:hypothetical protein
MPGLTAEDSDSFSKQHLRSTVGGVYCPLQDQKSIEEHLGIDIWNFPRVLASPCRAMSMASYSHSDNENTSYLWHAGSSHHIHPGHLFSATLRVTSACPSIHSQHHRLTYILYLSSHDLALNPWLNTTTLPFPTHSHNLLTPTSKKRSHLTQRCTQKKTFSTPTRVRTSGLCLESAELWFDLGYG